MVMSGPAGRRKHFREASRGRSLHPSPFYLGLRLRASLSDERGRNIRDVASGRQSSRPVHLMGLDSAGGAHSAMLRPELGTAGNGMRVAGSHRLQTELYCQCGC
ncbi:hypothetical protein JZ751_000658 [Albula glossodonta]|uniref:Uncharacterized protein n=1 Tax=Albula glossodonta TaxID=121402 RepID=A0A8T2PX73_9TELE|nr:hypothetical protein JZ751_000658 [Albula glossodonta]